MNRRCMSRNSTMTGTIMITPAAFTSPSCWVLLWLNARYVVEIGSSAGFEMNVVGKSSSF